MIIARSVKGKKDKEYKIIRCKNTVFLTPPSSEQALNPPPLKRGGVLKLNAQQWSNEPLNELFIEEEKDIAKVIYNNTSLIFKEVLL